jgi:hypothetical protein
VTGRTLSSAYRDVGFTPPRTDDRAITFGALDIPGMINLPLERITDLALWIMEHEQATVAQAMRSGLAISASS